MPAGHAVDPASDAGRGDPAVYQSRLPLRGGGAVGRWRLAQLGAVYAAICAHGAVVAYTDPLPDPTFITLLLLFSVQLSLLLGVMLAVFLLTSNTIDVRLGLCSIYISRYRAFYATALLAVSTFAAAGLYRLALAHGGAAPSLVWERPGFLPLWVAARTSLLGFQVAAAHAAVLSLRAPSEPWLASVAAVGL